MTHLPAEGRSGDAASMGCKQRSGAARAAIDYPFGEFTAVNDEFEERLVRDFPHLFQYSAGLRRIRCGEGWFPLIELLCKQIQGTVNGARTAQPTIMYIEEKFGVMRVACSAANTPVQKLISAAEQASSSFCEVCGALGETARTRHGWIKTLCTRCVEGVEEIPPLPLLESDT